MKYRKKPVVVEAVQWTGNNVEEISVFTDAFCDWRYENDVKRLFIETLEGTMKATPGDWIIRGVNGEYYPCKPDIFEKTYEILEKP